MMVKLFPPSEIVWPDGVGKAGLCLIYIHSGVTLVPSVLVLLG